MFGFVVLYIVSTPLNADALVKRTQVMMGTYISISLPKEKLPLSNLAFECLKKVEMALSSYDENAQIYRLNRERNISISSDTYEALELSKQYYQETQEYFDITIGSITKDLFHFGEQVRLPSQRELSQARVDFNGLHFNKTRAWIDKGVKIDLGGMGKGFGVDKTVELLKEQGLERGMIALSGDIFCFHACEMAIQDPFSAKVLVDFRMAQLNTSISTSGNYRRFVKSKDNNHLINPKTKRSQKSFASITLISTRYSNADLDAYATAASVMPTTKAFVFLKSLEEVAYLVVTNDKKIYTNEKLKTLTKQMNIHSFEGLRDMRLIQSVPLRYD